MGLPSATGGKSTIAQCGFGSGCRADAEGSGQCRGAWFRDRREIPPASVGSNGCFRGERDAAAGFLAHHLSPSPLSGRSPGSFVPSAACVAGRSEIAVYRGTGGGDLKLPLENRIPALSQIEPESRCLLAVRTYHFRLKTRTEITLRPPGFRPSPRNPAPAVRSGCPPPATQGNPVRRAPA